MTKRTPARARPRGSTMTAAAVVAETGQNPQGGQSQRGTTSAIMPAGLRSAMDAGI